MLLATFAVVCMLLAACADDSSERQFAGDDQSTAAPSATSQPIPTALPVASPQALASPLSEEELFAPRGHGDLAALVLNGRVFLVRSSLEEPASLPIDQRWKPWVADVSPDGDRVAVLVSLAASDTTWKVLIVEPDGSVSQTMRIAGDDATVVASDVVTTGSGGLDWSPDGSRIAVALPTGGIYAADLDGAVVEMSPPRRVPRPGDLAWSNNGQAIAYTAQQDARSGAGIYVAPVAALPLDPVVLLKPDPTGNRSARDVTWTAGDDHVLAILERRETGGRGGDVLSVRSAGGQPEIIWSAGMLVGEGGAQEISLSPDGEVLAVLLAGPDGSMVELLQMSGTGTTMSELDARIERASIDWTAAGLLVVGGEQSEDQGAVPFAALIGVQGEVSRLEPAATPIASPQAIGSPAASPLASPVAVSPVASPAGTPATATPDSD